MKHILIFILLFVSLDLTTGTVVVNIDPCYAGPVQPKEVDLSQVDLLAQLIYSEAQGESLEGQMAVGQVVLNRMKRRNRTMRQVIFRQGQFDGVGTRHFYAYKTNFRNNYIPALRSYKAAVSILSGRKVLPSDIYYFYNPITSTDTKWISQLVKYQTIGNHCFARSKARDSSELSNSNSL